MIRITIPDRLSSQRLKQNNLGTIHSKPILQIAAEKAKLIKGLDQVWINSKSSELGKADFFPISKMVAHVIKTKEGLEIARALFNKYKNE